MFITLLSVIICITCGLCYYYVTEVMEPKSVENDRNEEEEEVITETAVSSFQGSYETQTKQIRMSWSLQSADQTVVSLKLFNGENYLADVTNLNSYVLNQAVYQFPGGENSFILKAEFDDGSMIEKETKVTIDYFSSISCATDSAENGVLVKLTYRYQKGIDLKIPRIVVNSLPYEYIFTFKESKKDESENGFITETTIFEIDSRMAETEETINTRWIFDSIGMSYDFAVKIPAKAK